MQAWREGKPSEVGDALRRGNVDYDAAIHAHEVTLALAQGIVAQERAEIERLKRERAAAMLTVVPRLTVPAAG